MTSEPDFFDHDAPALSRLSNDEPEIISSGNKIVDSIGELEGMFKGNLVPRAWYSSITMGKKGAKSDLVGITLLAEFVYRCRPNVTHKLSELKGSDGKRRRAIVYEKRFRDDLPYFSLGQLSEMFRIGKYRIRQALARLERRGVLKQYLRDVVIEHRAYNNFLYIELIPDKLKELSTPAPQKQHKCMVRKPHDPRVETEPPSCGNHTSPLRKPQETPPKNRSTYSEIPERNQNNNNNAQGRRSAADVVVDVASQQSGAAAPEPPHPRTLDPRPATVNRGKVNSPVKSTTVQAGNQESNLSRQAPSNAGKPSKVSKPAGPPVAPAAQSAGGRGLVRTNAVARAAAPPARTASTAGNKHVHGNAPESRSKPRTPASNVDSGTQAQSENKDDRPEKLVRFYEQAYCAKFGNKLKVTNADWDAVRQHFNDSDWQVPETALVVLKSWELVGKTDGDFNYGACQHPDKLRTAMKHFDDVCDYVKGNNFGNWPLDKVLGALARFSGLPLEEIEAFFADEVNAESNADHEQGHDAWTRLQPEVEAELKYHKENEAQITGAQKKFWLHWVRDYCLFHGEPPRDWKEDFYAVRKQKALNDENLHDRLFQRISEMFKAFRKWDLTHDKAVGYIDNPTWPILSNILRDDSFKKLLGTA